MSTESFAEEQTLYLQGFLQGAEIARAARGLPTFGATLGFADAAPQAKAAPESAPTGPDAVHFIAQNKFLAEGKKLSPPEEAKRRRHPLDVWDDIAQLSASAQYPKGDNVLSFRYHGLFYVAPAQDSYMVRLRLPGGILTTHQFRGIADIADDWGGGFVDVTTRANLQLREVKAAHAAEVVTGLQDLGIVIKGSGADNIRNVTGNPTAGIDPQELIDTRSLARAMHFHILHHREMYALPRKFNIAFDGGGVISVLEDSNDIGFSAVRVAEGKGAPAGVHFRLQLGGISGHKDFARDQGVLLTPEQCVPVADAVVRVFNENGDRTDRTKARLKYVLDRWGHPKFLAEVEKRLPFKLVHLPLSECEPRPDADRIGHLGFHPQKQKGLQYVGVLLPVGRLTTDQVRSLSDLADKHGSGMIRLTVWQNLLISDIPDEKVAAVKGWIESIGLHWQASNVRGALVACTGNAGCKFAASNTKRHAMEIARHVETQLELNHPVNIHLTGCPNSCAQHYLGDIGLLGAKVAAGEEMVEGYHIFVGGGYGSQQHIGREMYRSVAADQCPQVVEKMLRGYLKHRQDPAERFLQFVRRHPTEQLKLLFDSPG
ncbi:MAG TPA: NirA family protein [Gemmataceae bacterium]|jgi:ferredoxin-nitrite reductase|nr:NirA family protein [Gemmataceae bacterium]